VAFGSLTCVEEPFEQRNRLTPPPHTALGNDEMTSATRVHFKG
ncbi:MAG: hypothetical protein ACI9TH_004582, partial [Kiritimatiellia bacterium]